MSYSHSHRPAAAPSASSTNTEDILTSATANQPSQQLPGSYNDEILIRGIITRAIRNCTKSRDVIAEEMTFLIGAAVTKRALDSYTSESAQQNRFPLQYTRAFCEVTGDWELLRCVCSRAGLHAITAAEQELLELGREYIRQKRAQAAITALESRLSKVDL